MSKIGIALKEGITSEDAKKISKLIRDEGPKGVKAQIQGDELRVSSKKRDDLQAVQALVKWPGLRVRGAVHQLPLTRAFAQVRAYCVPRVRRESAGFSVLSAKTIDIRPAAALRVRSSALGQRWL